MWHPPLGEEALTRQRNAVRPTRGTEVIEYELIQQQAHELAARAEHQRLVREAKEARRLRQRPVAARFQRRPVRQPEC
ncbi:hypothetical protein P3T27_001630 [Kitasatospora sp. MAA19]|nr:hypothetical protein [Kitasatospora sp. MAA19]